MTSKSILRRKSDGKIFSVTFYSHWSDIKAEDGETDYVKWGWGSPDSGDELYVSHSKGFSYIVVGKEETNEHSNETV